MESTSAESGVRRRYVDTPDGQVHLRERPGIEPAIVFLHQTALSSRCYEPLMRQQVLPNRLLALDLPGFGASFRPEGWPGITKYSQWVLAALDGLSASRMHLFGHHTGACVASCLARSHAQRVASLVLCGPVCFTGEERARFREEFRKPLAPVEDGGHLLLNWQYTAQHNRGVAAEVVHEQVLDMLSAWQARPQAYNAVAEYDFAADLGVLTVPILLLTSPGDYFEDHVARCLAIRPDLPVVQVRGGNLATELDPDGIARALFESTVGRKYRI